VKTWIPIAAVISVVLGLVVVVMSHKKPPVPPIPFPPPIPPYENFIAALGVIEPSTGNVEIASPVSEIVEKIYISANQVVEKGTPLFKVNTQFLEAELQMAKEQLATAQARYNEQLALPRTETVPISKFKLDASKAELQNALERLETVKRLRDPKAIAQDDFNARLYGAQAAEALFLQSQAELDLLLAGAWSKTLDIYRAEVKTAEAKVESIKIQIERSTIRAPFKGMILVSNIKVGEFIQATGLVEISSTPMIFGSLETLELKISINEEDVWRFKPGSRAIAYVRGNPSLFTELEYDGFEPFLYPKSTLAGSSSEIVDTRVLVVSYKCKRTDLPIFTGQVLDAYIEAEPRRFQK
jgi:HlyD family secretion protein